MKIACPHCGHSFDTEKHKQGPPPDHSQHAVPTSRPKLFDLCEHQRIEIPETHRHLPVTEMDTSFGMHMDLRNAGIQTLGDLHGLTYGHFRPIRGMGKNGAMYLREAIHDYLTDIGAPTTCAEPAPPPRHQRTRIPPGLHPLPLNRLPLPVPLKKALTANGFRTLGQLHREQLSLRRGIGPLGERTLTTLIERAAAGEFTTKPRKPKPAP